MPRIVDARLNALVQRISFRCSKILELAVEISRQDVGHAVVMKAQVREVIHAMGTIIVGTAARFANTLGVEGKLIDLNHD